MNTTCILCGSQDYKIVFIEHGIPIVECSFCKHVYSTYRQEEHYEGYWDDGEEEYDLEWWDTAHREIYNDFISRFLIHKEGTILDVGCGLGFFVKTVTEKCPGWKAIGYEISKKAVDYARKVNGLQTVYSGMVQESGLPENSIDIITLWDVIEHIPYPHSLLEYLWKILKPGGILFLQTPNFPFQLWKARLKVWLKGMQPGGHYLEAKDHINNYKMETLSRLCLQCGFENPQFYILKPIMSVAGSRSALGKLAKKLYFYISKWIFTITGKKLNISNTLFLTVQKPL